MVTYKKLTYNSSKIQVESAIRDGNGAQIDTNYVKKGATKTYTTGANTNRLVLARVNNYTGLASCRIKLEVGPDTSSGAKVVYIDAVWAGRGHALTIESVYDWNNAIRYFFCVVPNNTSYYTSNPPEIHIQQNSAVARTIKATIIERSGDVVLMDNLTTTGNTTNRNTRTYDVNNTIGIYDNCGYVQNAGWTSGGWDRLDNDRYLYGEAAVNQSLMAIASDGKLWKISRTDKEFLLPLDMGHSTGTWAVSATWGRVAKVIRGLAYSNFTNTSMQTNAFTVPTLTTSDYGKPIYLVGTLSNGNFVSSRKITLSMETPSSGSLTYIPIGKIDRSDQNISTTAPSAWTLNTYNCNAYTIDSNGKLTHINGKEIKDTNTWTAMVGATSSANGSVGYVNATPPKDGYNTKFLRADGTWAVPSYIADTDCKTSSANKASTKLFLIGAETQSSANNVGATTQSNVNCYIGTDNCLYSNGTKVTTTSSAASSGGTTLSLVTTGEKYTWNSKASSDHTHSAIYRTSTVTEGAMSSQVNCTTYTAINNNVTSTNADANLVVTTTPSNGDTYGTTVSVHATSTVADSTAIFSVQNMYTPSGGTQTGATLFNISNDGHAYAKTSGSIASGNQYLVSGGVVYTALTNGTVTKVGTGTVGGTLKIMYLSNGTPTNGTQLYSKNININGTNQAVIRSTNADIGTIYAPTTAGSSGQIVKSNGSGAPGWVDQSSITAGAASKLTNTSKIGDTNQPVYFKADGTPAAISYTIDKSVPSNAVFTDANVLHTLDNSYTTGQPILYPGASNNATGGVKYTSNATVVPSTGVITAGGFKGPLLGGNSKQFSFGGIVSYKVTGNASTDPVTLNQTNNAYWRICSVTKDQYIANNRSWHVKLRIVCVNTSNTRYTNDARSTSVACNIAIRHDFVVEFNASKTGGNTTILNDTDTGRGSGIYGIRTLMPKSDSYGPQIELFKWYSNTTTVNDDFKAAGTDCQVYVYVLEDDIGLTWENNANNKPTTTSYNSSYYNQTTLNVGQYNENYSSHKYNINIRGGCDGIAGSAWDAIANDRLQAGSTNPTGFSYPCPNAHIIGAADDGCAYTLSADVGTKAFKLPFVGGYARENSGVNDTTVNMWKIVRGVDFKGVLITNMGFQYVKKYVTDTYKGTKTAFANLPTSGNVEGDIWQLSGVSGSNNILYHNPYSHAWTTTATTGYYVVRPTPYVRWNGSRWDLVPETGDSLYIVGSLDANGNFIVDSSKTIVTDVSAGYTFLKIGEMDSYYDTSSISRRFTVKCDTCKAYTLNSSGKITHIDGKQIYDSGNSGGTVTTTGTISANYVATFNAANSTVIKAGHAVDNTTTVGSLVNLTSWANSTNLVTRNVIAYWDGRYQSNSNVSNLAYCKKGAFNTACTYDVESTVADDSKLTTGAAVKAFVEGKGYTTNTGTVTTTGTLTANQIAVWNANSSTVLKSVAASSLAPGASLAQSGSSGTSLSADTWYTLTVGASTCTFKTPTALVKQTAQSSTTTTYPLLFSAQSSPTSGTAYEAKYSTNCYIKSNQLYSNGTVVSVSGHTHNYAGSSSAGGAATTAVAMSVTTTSSIGTTAGVQFYSGSDITGSTTTFFIETFVSGNNKMQRATNIADPSNVYVRTTSDNSTWTAWTYSYAVWKA